MAESFFLTPKLITQSFCVVIPCYNEEKQVGAVLKGLQDAFIKNVVVVDDGSVDKSTEIIGKFNVILLRNEKNRGEGYSLKKGLKYAYDNHLAQYLVTVDADGQHSIKDVLKVMKTALQSKADIVYGIRRFDSKTPLSKRILSRVASLCVRVLYNMENPDSQCGLRCYKRDIIPKLNFSDGYEYSTESARIIQSLGDSAVPVSVEAIYTDYSLSRGVTLVKGIKILGNLIKQRLGETFTKKQNKNSLRNSLFSR